MSFAYLVFFPMCLFLSTQKLTKAVVEILESQLMANGRGQVFVTETGSTLSVCLPLSWWGRRTSPVKRTTSGRLRNQAVFVSSWMPYGIQILHVHTCARMSAYIWMFSQMRAGRAA